MKRFFKINVGNYVVGKEFFVFRPASLQNPKNNAVMFIGDEYMAYKTVFLEVSECLIFWPDKVPVLPEIQARHAVVCCDDPHLRYCLFFSENDISYLPPKEKGRMVEGAFIADGAVIESDVTIMPFAYIGGEVRIGSGTYIGAGTKILGEVQIGNDVIIRENTVIGADGLSTDRDMNGHAATMPQFGGIIIEDKVQIGANTVVARGAIDNTIVHSGAKIDNQCFISHNVEVGRDTFVVGETIMFGSSSTGERAYISGNSTIRNGVHIGKDSLVGMGAVVTKRVEENSVVKGNPAR